MGFRWSVAQSLLVCASAALLPVERVAWVKKIICEQKFYPRIRSSVSVGSTSGESFECPGHSVVGKSKPLSTSTVFPFHVTYKGSSLEIEALPGESILAAMERHQVSKRLGFLAELPSECRRGNCLTCTAAAKLSCTEGTDEGKSALSTALRSDDGLAPSISQWIQKQGFVLTCSTCVVGPGVEVELGVNHDAWQKLYRKRLEGEETQLAARKALARVIRSYAESNVDEWRRETEQVLRESPSAEMDTSFLNIDDAIA